MKRDARHWVIWLLGLVVAVGSIQGPATASPASAADRDATELSAAFDDSPEHQALVKLLGESGADEMLRTASSVAMSKIADFADVIIGYSLQNQPAEAELFLFKEGDEWVAYSELPTRKDHPAVFSTLARQYCKPLYKDLQGIAFIDDTWQSENPQKRTINIVCSELIDNQWQDHRFTFTYEYDDRKGWHITGQSEMRQPSAGAEQKESVSESPPEPAQPGIKAKATWGRAKQAIAEIFRFIGGNPQPVFINFGTAGHDFIQFHYVAENGSTDIQSVDWNNGKISSPQGSRLAKPCPPIPCAAIDFDLVPKIFAEISRKAKQGEMVNVNLSRRFANGCQEPIWQGITTSAKHVRTVTYSFDGRQTGIEEYSF
ncbi:MAG: hypothetical protein ACYC9M_15995 [Desulfobulbaceae bacterium]